MPKIPGLEKKIKDKSAKVAVIGQGYVGLPLALAIHNAGFFVWGIDTNREKIATLKKGKSYIDDVAAHDVADALKTKKFVPTSSFAPLSKTDIAIIAVPTPLDKYKIPDLSAVEGATREIARRVHAEELIILESTTYPGTTDEILMPILSKRRIVGKWYLAFSPERVDPGNKQFTIANTPKVVGGVDSDSTKLAALFYGKIIEHVVPVSSARVAEMTKLLENIFRIVNISLVNELALLAGKMDIDIWEVIRAASTKPYGFMPFYPGPGIGGHCIAVDPFYLSYKARRYGFFTRFIDLAGEINELMPHYVVTKVDAALNYSAKKSINGSRILLVGVSYKKDIKDTRESAAFAIADILNKKGAVLEFYDPYIEKFQIANSKLQIHKLKTLETANMADFDAVVIITDHAGIDYEKIAQSGIAIVDTRHVVTTKKPNIYCL
ncbi:MAG: hypothetical protein A2249_01650 [Candidatus Jacksonbacteria bacterium RIFOXYA2_FULL_44_7]|uniref:UDP-glucose/GDP-mannose dehydrogenase C-terminal domain-containing protein n=1 Tax=Candidatus Jacksonbacteria bacterium RIFCSPLOWO2_02_FULL_44_20 TaxID=1798460 RepID=A0A1G2A8F4_9BACT|nr:MAG: Nucleotide sugar dehydrogenase [Parcubacteria group bacterium GW2011_GWC2_44_17]KKT50055.1 MAG: Nucleotide sugar dehydrogenase [Parcubacteria group bacterium GW2011_GWF2_44_17]OGY72766.1 MAG: hypothetical protein A3H61_02330 [Candidatus Jacksonbacteria bacterium RIFCSPLOWO2_02_FULL_44_20]OGY75088.1 MAG: hypothetical protein A3H07_04265 [Candidatus Jacksonbacteria bacterium RIFCSPLOWO2_12_FULL_44_15b]OGY77260.1 MAG: hypothetical protein A2249_01650 [Candidatus Jacksonbacteria bacterium R